jgi:hypothetical protein
MPMVDSISVARQTLYLIDANVPLNFQVPIEWESNFRIGLATFARCRALLSGMLLVVEGQRHDLAGLLLRSLFEAWIYGQYGLFGGAQAILELEANENAWADELNQNSGSSPPTSQGNREKLSMRAAIRKLEQVLPPDRKVISDVTLLDWYDFLFRSESFDSVHGTTSSRRYVTREDGGTLGVSFDPPEEEQGLARLRLGSVMTALFAKDIWRVAGLEPSVFDVIDF